MKQNFQNQPQDTGPGPYQVGPPKCDPMQHGQTQPYPPIVPPQGETKSKTVPPSMKTKFRGDGFCRGLYLLLGMEGPWERHYASALIVSLTQVIF
ncbi:uncharacterized protein LOC103494082 isoform X1 [Cucumis melo]|uniref:Uncharacterized protein LOC103494082 isoform X1 n=1 Tax=Cucumis melo TaxID=3656 RepID=A0ABM3KGT6_CUCME|nr:uncharacterized protein LOC103494082 isoform X1 [Cucumis melo]